MILNHGSLFSGIGGFDLAAEWAGWKNIFHCEINPFGQKILKYYWPNAKLFEDITKTDFKKYNGKIDIISGGFPCQPFSIAGKRKGTEDNRNLWPEMYRAINEIAPTWIVAENVLGITNWSKGMVLEQVYIDLENSGYNVQAFVIPACSVNAPHRRDRVWFVAYSESIGNRRCSGNKCRNEEWKIQQDEQTWNKMGCKTKRCNSNRIASDTINTGTGIGLRNNEEWTKKNKRWKEQSFNKSWKDGEFITYTNNDRLERRLFKNKSKISGGVIKKQFAQIQSNQWENFPTQFPICSRNDGVSNKLDGITLSKWRNESIKAYGNAIVPQVAFQIFKTINEYYDKYISGI